MSGTMLRIGLGALVALPLTTLAADPPPQPDYLTSDPVVTRHDATTGSDLLTGGLGLDGLSKPLPALPATPTPDQLRTAALHANYRALVDMTPSGGFGRLYGPLVGPTAADPQGRIPGTEYLAFARDSTGDEALTLAVQIPDAFDPARACIIAVPSSGSRGVYGGIAIAEWGLKRGCAIALTDKGTGTGAHALSPDTIGLLRGERAPAAGAGPRSTFTAPLTPAQRAAFVAETPDRLAFKHAHSRRNPEAAWGEHVVLSIRFALWAVNAREVAAGRPALGWDQVTVIATAVSNGGGAVLRAAEIAPPGMIDAVVASEPNLTPRHDARIAIRQGNGADLRQHSRPLYDTISLINLYQGCANLAEPGALLNNTARPLGEARCLSLSEAGLLRAASVEAQAQEARALILGASLLPDQQVLQPAYWFLNVPQSVTLTYANAYARAGVEERVCGIGFAATAQDGTPAPLPAAAEAALFATSNGIPPTGGVNLVNERAPGGPVIDRLSRSASTSRQDQNADGARCLRALMPGEAVPGGGDSAALRDRITQGIEAIRATGRLQGIPTIILHGRADPLIAPNHTSRPYTALSLLEQGDRARLSYVEVLHAHHLDALNGIPGFGERFVPLHPYLVQALDLMADHLARGTPLPPSQVVRTRPGAGPLQAGEGANLPPIAAAPAAGDRIGFDGRVLSVPD